MVEEAMQEYALASTEAAYEDPGEQAPVVFMDSEGLFHDVNASHWWDQKHPAFTIHNCSENNNWETAAVYMSVAEESTRKATGRVNAPMEWWGFTNSPRYHADRFHNYRN